VEIKTMLALNEIELKQTHFYQEIAEEERQIGGKRSVPLFGKEGLGEILFDKSPSIPLLQRGR
jgi:predicted transposase YdaD